MKKNFKYAFLSATALMGAVSFSACSSSDDVVDNPDFLPEKNAVKAQFAISLPSNVNAPVTRMIATDVQQADNSFLGMQDIVMIPFATKPANADASQLGEPISLGDIGYNGLQQLTGSTANYKVYSDVTVPLGTSAFLFYAQTQEQNSKTTEYKFTNGSTIKTAPSTAGKAGYTFAPDTIFIGDYTSTTDNVIGNNIITYLTQIAQTPNWTNNSTTTPNEGLRNLYEAFTSLKAGSSFSVQRVVKDLYNSIKNNTDALSQAIVTRITTTYASVSGGGDLIFNNNISGYPANLNLPDGAAKITCNATSGVFSFDNNLNQYAFPAALWYRANTAIKVSNNKQTNTSNLYAGKTTWGGTDGVLSLYTDGSSVTSTTRSIALEDSIQYAVGRLDVQVQCADVTLLDQKGNEVTVPTDGFPVSAILVGGQKPVNFLFTEPIGTKEYTIYDKATGVNAKNGSFDGTNYTLALETAAGTDVNIAIELENTTGVDFYGQNGQIIPADSKFYLSTALSANDATETGGKIFKQDFYTQAKLTIKKGTSADTNSEGLGAATNTIPDLRTPQLELGLAVDLHWQPGHTFEIQF